MTESDVAARPAAPRDPEPESAKQNDSVQLSASEEPLADRPGRPEMQRTSPPRSQVMTRPSIVDLALRLFRVGIGLGGVAVLSGVVWRADARRSLIDLMADSSASESAKSLVANVAVYGSLVALAIFLLVELIMLSRIASGRSWPRIFLAFWVPVHLVALFVLQAVIAGDRWHGLMIQSFMAIQGLLTVVGTVMLFSKGISRWLKQRPVHVEPTPDAAENH